jgi:hypothetical protein
VQKNVVSDINVAFIQTKTVDKQSAEANLLIIQPISGFHMYSVLLLNDDSAERLGVKSHHRA